VQFRYCIYIHRGTQNLDLHLLHLVRQELHGAQQDDVWHWCPAAQEAGKSEGGDSQAYSGLHGAELGDDLPEYRQTDRDGIHAATVVACTMLLYAVPHLA